MSEKAACLPQSLSGEIIAVEGAVQPVFCEYLRMVPPDRKTSRILSPSMSAMASGGVELIVPESTKKPPAFAGPMFL